MTEPIREVGADNVRERLVKEVIEKHAPWKLWPTPRYYFTDFHINQVQPNNRENYIGDLEVKWLRSSSDKSCLFPFNKLQNMLIAPPYTDDPKVFHRILFRFTDGISIVPAMALATCIPRIIVRNDGDKPEPDYAVEVSVETIKRGFKPILIQEP